MIGARLTALTVGRASFATIARQIHARQVAARRDEETR